MRREDMEGDGANRSVGLLDKADGGVGSGRDHPHEGRQRRGLRLGTENWRAASS